MLTVVISSMVDGQSLAAFCCIALGVAVAVWGAALKKPVYIAGGALVALWGPGARVWLAIQGHSLLRWGSLTVIGVLLVIGAAYVERHRSRLALLWQKSTGS